MLSIHALNAIQTGFKKIVIQTVDSDVIVTLVHHFKNFLTLNENVKIVALRSGKSFQLVTINSMSVSLRPNLSNGLPLIYYFSECDTTSSFYRKGKTSI